MGEVEGGCLHTLYQMTLSFSSSVILILISEMTSELLNPCTINNLIIKSSDEVPLYNIF